MRDFFAVWREKPWVWAVPLALVAVNVVLIIFFETAFSGQVAALRRSYDSQANLLERLRKERQKAEDFIVRLEAQDQAMVSLYDDHFATEGERFTAVLRDIRKRAREAGMNPLTFSYPEQSVDTYGLNRRSINFGVDGSYEQLRRFINLLELTDQFVTLEGVKLGGVKGVRGGMGDPRLSIRLSLSTIFVKGESPAIDRAEDPAVPTEEARRQPRPPFLQDGDSKRREVQAQENAEGKREA